MKQQYDQVTPGSNDPKEKKIVNEQEQNKAVNTGDQPFEQEDFAKKENQPKEKEESSTANGDEITNKADNDILNKDQGVQPE